MNVATAPRKRFNIRRRRIIYFGYFGIRKVHPSFLRDRVYADHYERHCRFFEGMLRYGESLGKRYYALTPSYIPALAQRPASGRKE